MPGTAGPADDKARPSPVPPRSLRTGQRRGGAGAQESKQAAKIGRTNTTGYRPPGKPPLRRADR